MQKQPSGEMRPVAYASRSMTETERRYAQIDKKALAIIWALEHWAEFLIRMRFNVETDHKPLIPLLSTKLIDALPVHIQRFRMILMRFDFAIAHVPCKLMYTADSLSRSPQECKAQESKSWNDLHDEVVWNARTVLWYLFLLYWVVLSLYLVVMSLYSVINSLYSVLIPLYSVLMSLYAVLSSLYSVLIPLQWVLPSLY